jgi:hypothetical protein
MVVREALDPPCTFISDAVFAQVHKVNKLGGLYVIVLCVCTPAYSKNR